MKINMARGRFSPAPPAKGHTHSSFGMCVCVCPHVRMGGGSILGIQLQGCVHLTAFSMYGNVCAFLK